MAINGPTRSALAALALGLGVLWAAPPAQALGTASATSAKAVRTPSGAVAQMADWIVSSGDSGGRPFIIVDKVAARVFVYDAHGRLQGAAPVLVGLARGDDSAAGVGDRDLAALRRNERTTPAGRFVAGFGPAEGHRSVLWVDYADAISLHPVVTSNPKERRLERLRSRTPKDHRITYGCINVPTAFYSNVVLKAFAGGRGIVYVLPDTRPLEEVFPAFAAQARTHAAQNGAPDGASAGSGGEPGAQPASGSDRPPLR